MILTTDIEFYTNFCKSYDLENYSFVGEISHFYISSATTLTVLEVY